MPMLIPIESKEFLDQIRIIVREEMSRSSSENMIGNNILETKGLLEKPLYKIQEVCSIFKITKPTIYGWIKHGDLRPVKIRSRVYFLGKEVMKLIQL